MSLEGLLLEAEEEGMGGFENVKRLEEELIEEEEAVVVFSGWCWAPEEPALDGMGEENDAVKGDAPADAAEDAAVPEEEGFLLSNSD